MIKLIVLDFDGVVVESTMIKTDAFRKLFDDYPKHQQAIVDYHKRHFGVSRYDKFAYIYKNILKQPLGNAKITELGKRFSALVVDAVKQCRLVPGAQDFLAHYSRKVKIYIASATPEKELHDIVKVRGLEKYFTGIYGAPVKKSEAILLAMKENNVDKNKVLFVGDSTADYEEAQKAGVQFIGRLSDPTKNIFPDGIKVVNDLVELGNIVEESL